MPVTDFEGLKYHGILAAVREMPWALRPEKLAVVLDLLRFRAEGGRLSAEEIAERIGAARPQTRPAAGAVAVIPIFGVIVQRASMLAQSSGAMGTEQIAAAFRAAVDDPNVGAVVLQINSPGGGVYGVPELAETIIRARGSKPIVAVADSEAASAAYWIASAADEVVVTPSGEVGSIGVWTAHNDMSRLYDAMGIGVSLISAGKYKTEGNPFEPLSDEARTAIQQSVDDYYSLFVKAVAKGRGVGVDAVRSGFGEGRMVTAQRAVREGLADRVETFDQVVSRLQGRGPRPAGRAEGQGGTLYSCVCGPRPLAGGHAMGCPPWDGKRAEVRERPALLLDDEAACGCTVHSRPGSTTWQHIDGCPNAALNTAGEAVSGAPPLAVADPADGPTAADRDAATAAGADTDLRRRRLRLLAH